jgi:hypothetical protein
MSKISTGNDRQPSAKANTTPPSTSEPDKAKSPSQSATDAATQASINEKKALESGEESPD